MGVSIYLQVSDVACIKMVVDGVSGSQLRAGIATSLRKKAPLGSPIRWDRSFGWMSTNPLLHHGQ